MVLSKTFVPLGDGKGCRYRVQKLSLEGPDSTLAALPPSENPGGLANKLIPVQDGGLTKR